MPEGAIDMFVNVTSFQEMALDQVNSYLEAADRVATGGAIYLRNDWEGVRSRQADYRVPPRGSRYS